MDRMMEHSNSDIIRYLIEKYGIVDEGGIVDLTDLESREEMPLNLDAEDDALNAIADVIE